MAASNGTAIDGKKGDVRDGRIFPGLRNFEEARKSAAVGKIGCGKEAGPSDPNSESPEATRKRGSEALQIELAQSANSAFRFSSASDKFRSRTRRTKRGGCSPIIKPDLYIAPCVRGRVRPIDHRWNRKGHLTKNKPKCISRPP